MSQPKRLIGWRYALFVGSFVGAIGLIAYPVMISPMLDPQPFKNIQTISRKNIKQEEIQPGNMKVWSDPFDRPKDK